ncbi:sterigmatocystin 8-O-methyltransferase [Fusarium beomiforme]|uniref:Sterigmatocystin 8-O-methyltransferase n=1 Tax=Fusarium beomiforme TaxID=44412 RepID=A0A9P5AN32_9HYPO|nr:sterigmatocystin 8-O-methyltransferase [Fusarium beomiforme]
MSLTDKVISRSLQSCVTKSSTVDPSTQDYFIRYALYAIGLLESRLDAADNSWFPLLSKYNQELEKRETAHNRVRQTCYLASETLHMALDSKDARFGDIVPKVLAKLCEEVEPVFNDEAALLNNIGPKVSREDLYSLEKEDKERRLGLMKKDGHLWCATYLMRSLTAEEREQFPPGVPDMAKTAILALLI